MKSQSNTNLTATTAAAAATAVVTAVAAAPLVVLQLTAAHVAVVSALLVSPPPPCHRGLVTRPPALPSVGCTSPHTLIAVEQPPRLLRTASSLYYASSPRLAAYLLILGLTYLLTYLLAYLGEGRGTTGRVVCVEDACTRLFHLFEMRPPPLSPRLAEEARQAEARQAEAQQAKARQAAEARLNAMSATVDAQVTAMLRRAPSSFKLSGDRVLTGHRSMRATQMVAASPYERAMRAVYTPWMRSAPELDVAEPSSSKRKVNFSVGSIAGSTTAGASERMGETPSSSRGGPNLQGVPPSPSASREKGGEAKGGEAKGRETSKGAGGSTRGERELMRRQQTLPQGSGSWLVRGKDASNQAVASSRPERARWAKLAATVSAPCMHTHLSMT